MVVPAKSIPSKPAPYLPTLTGLRAVAAYLVFLHHYNPAVPGSAAWPIFNQGYIGVSIFFVLSGFLIHYQYAGAYARPDGWSWRRYLQNRFARVYPLYALLLLLTVGVAAGRGQPMSLAVIGLNLTLLKGFFDAYKFSGIAQSWSLTAEGCFYLLAPFLFPALRRWGPFRLAVVLVGTGLLLWLVARPMGWPGLFGTLPFVLFYTFFGRGFEFVAGMWLARRWRQGCLFTSPYTTAIGLLIMLACVCWQAGFASTTASTHWLLASEAVVYNLVLPVGIGLLVAGLLTRPSAINRLLSHPSARALGHSSYAFYLIHAGIVARGLQKMGITNTWLLFVLLVALSHALYYLIERPLQRLLRAD